MTDIFEGGTEGGVSRSTDPEYHRAHLKRRYRVWAGVCRKCYHSTTKVTDKLSMPKDLKETFGIEVLQDKPEVHPNTVCNNCYLQKLMNSTKSSLENFQWKHHTGDCPQCKIFQQEEVGGRPKTS